MPEAYKCKDNDTSCYYGSKGDTDFFQIAFFHLQADFTNILSGSEQTEKYETNAGTAYIASSKYENRVWIMFSGTDYMMELRDRNKVLSNKEIYKIIDGARLSGETPSVLYDSIEWTEELQESYVKQIESYK
ncbi:MAG: hypothetical protein HFH14_06725 [Lachnospiraceae bacterium]|nr:hypothetical protein [Lachnospiraceae bacterium]